MYLLIATSPSRRRTRSEELPMVPVAALNTATGIASESYAARSGQTRSTANPTFPPTAVFVVCVSTDMHEVMRGERTVELTQREFELLEYLTRNERIVVPRIACLLGKMSGGRYVSCDRVSSWFGIRSRP
jgi:DNA-binding response OmpR family regulator